MNSLPKESQHPLPPPPPLVPVPPKREVAETCHYLLTFVLHDLLQKVCTYYLWTYINFSAHSSELILHFILKNLMFIQVDPLCFCLFLRNPLTLHNLQLILLAQYFGIEVLPRKTCNVMNIKHVDTFVLVNFHKTKKLFNMQWNTQDIFMNQIQEAHEQVSWSKPWYQYVSYYAFFFSYLRKRRRSWKGTSRHFDCMFCYQIAYLHVFDLLWMYRFQRTWPTIMSKDMRKANDESQQHLTSSMQTAFWWKKQIACFHVCFLIRSFWICWNATTLWRATFGLQKWFTYFV